MVLRRQCRDWRSDVTVLRRQCCDVQNDVAVLQRPCYDTQNDAAEVQRRFSVVDSVLQKYIIEASDRRSEAPLPASDG